MLYSKCFGLPLLFWLVIELNLRNCGGFVSRESLLGMKARDEDGYGLSWMLLLSKRATGSRWPGSPRFAEPSPPSSPVSLAATMPFPLEAVAAPLFLRFESCWRRELDLLWLVVCVESAAPPPYMIELFLPWKVETMELWYFRIMLCDDIDDSTDACITISCNRAVLSLYVSVLYAAIL